MVDDHFKDAVSLVGKEHFLNNLTPLQIISFVCIDGIIGITLFRAIHVPVRGNLDWSDAFTPSLPQDGTTDRMAVRQRIRAMIQTGFSWCRPVMIRMCRVIISFFQVQWQAVCFFLSEKTKPDSVAPLTITLKTSSSQIIVHHFGYVSSIR